MTRRIAAMTPALKDLQGTWEIASLEMDGTKLPEGAVRGSRIVVRGDRFTTISMGAEYGGTIKVAPKKSPKTLDLVFETGPEKGNTSLAIYELAGDTWKLCLTVTGKTRPATFTTKPGSGHAFEVLKRSKEASPREALLAELALLAGEWSLVSAVRDGQALPPGFVKTGVRLVKGNETTVSFGGQVFLKAAFTVDPKATPKTIDYIVTGGDSLGEVQLGIYELAGDRVTYSLAAAGSPRPKSLATAPPAGVLTVWKRKQNKGAKPK